MVNNGTVFSSITLHIRVRNVRAFGTSQIAPGLRKFYVWFTVPTIGTTAFEFHDGDWDGPLLTTITQPGVNLQALPMGRYWMEFTEVDTNVFIVDVKDFGVAS